MPEIVCGFDGFVDEMIRVVGERTAPDTFTPMGSLAELGGLVTAAVGRNSLREIVVERQDAGGCAINLGDGLAALGDQVRFFGTVGAPVHPAFAAVLERFAEVRALGTVYGRTLCFEFRDGKFMFPAVQQLAELTPAVIDGAVDAYAAACRRAPVVCLTNWTLYPHMTAVWRRLQERVFATLDHDPWVFVDLVDPSSRSTADIRAMADALLGFGRVALSVNRTELAVLGERLGLPATDDVPVAAAALRAKLGIAQIVVHNSRINAVAHADGIVVRPAGPFCDKPLKSTGAGDRFNSGYVHGLATGLGHAERLDLGAAVAGFFIRHARSGSLAEVQPYAPVG
jgi:sugar/nucleoside kinase (ribokinase family)